MIDTLPATQDQLAERHADAECWLREMIPTGAVRVSLLEPGGTWWDLRPIVAGKECLRGRDHEDLLSSLPVSLVAEADAGSDVFVTPYPHPYRSSRAGSVALTRRHVHADIDGPLDLEQVELLGAMVVASGSLAEDGRPRGHAYVRLDREVTPEQHQRLCRDVGRFVGGDAADMSKHKDNDVLRVPGTWNYKDPSNPRPVRWLVCPDHPSVRSWAPDELAEVLGVELSTGAVPPTAPAAGLRAPAAVTADRGHSYAERTAAGIVADLTDARGWGPEQRDDRERGWERLSADAAYRLARLALADWSGLDMAEAERIFTEHAPTDTSWTARDVAAKWRSQYQRARRAGPLELPADDLAGIEIDFTRPEDRGKVTEQDALGGQITTTDAAAEDLHAYEVQRRLHWLRADREARELLAAEQAEATGDRDVNMAGLLRPGGSLILDTPDDPVPVWGAGDRVLMAEGESLVLVGSAGIGKTTLAQQWALGRCGLPEFAELLNLPVVPGAGRVLYLAMDRPRQALRSMRRMVTEAHRSVLDDRLVFWEGPPPVNFTDDPDQLARMCGDAGADSVVVDSLKDIGSVLEDEGGTAWNRARQKALVAGVQVLELHHNRKVTSGGSTATTLDNVYGSTWITAGAGSVVLLAGKPGDPVVKLHHLKQPAAEVGPLDVIHDHHGGRSFIFDEVDLIGLARAGADGVTAVEVARALFDTDRPSAAQREKARRRLNAEVKAGRLVLVDAGDKGLNRPARWGVK
ncbi:AAA family ATPase [Enemella sp. A6]|uniref:AAA family ATPase n=1 Tax=Enemella sp. A6 TaxID=3440152 RepID=UPI003EC0DFCC